MFIYLSFLASFWISYLTIPKVIKFAKKNDIVDKPAQNKIHETAVPTLGGIPVFISVWVITFSWAELTGLSCFFYNPMLISSAILLITGVVDDLVRVSIPKRLILETIAILIVLYCYDLRIPLPFESSGTAIIDSFLSITFTIIFGLVIINSLNFIDGIDTLCAGIVISILTPLSICFLTSGERETALICFAAIGSLFAFSKFNSSPAKIFLGDTGSLFLGFLTFFLIIKFWSLNLICPEKSIFSSPESVIIGILFIPLLDFLSVLISRLNSGNSIIRRDKSHFHYKLLGLGLTHTKASNFLCTLNSLSIAFVIIFRNLSGTLQILILVVFYILIRIVLKILERRKIYQPKFQNDKSY